MDSGASKDLTAGGGVRVENVLQRRILYDRNRFQSAGDKARDVVKADFVAEIQFDRLFIRGVQARRTRIRPARWNGDGLSGTISPFMTLL